MNKAYIALNYKLILLPLLFSFVGFGILMLVGSKGLPYAAAGGLLCFLAAADRLMGKNVVGDDGVMMSLLPVSARTTVWTKVLLCGTWVGVICSIPAFLMLRNGGAYIDAEVSRLEGGVNIGRSLFYRGLPQYRYAIETNPSALDTAVGDLMDSGAGVVQIGLMTTLIPLILFLMGCYFGLAVLISQLYLHPLLKRYPTMVVSVLAMVIFGGMALGVLMLIKGTMEQGFLSLFAGELVTFVFFGGITWFLGRAAVKRLEKGYDV